MIGQTLYQTNYRLYINKDRLRALSTNMQCVDKGCGLHRQTTNKYVYSTRVVHVGGEGRLEALANKDKGV